MQHLLVLHAQTFRLLTQNVGRGPRKTLRRLLWTACVPLNIASILNRRGGDAFGGRLTAGSLKNIRLYKYSRALEWNILDYNNDYDDGWWHMKSFAFSLIKNHLDVDIEKLSRDPCFGTKRNSFVITLMHKIDVFPSVYRSFSFLLTSLLFSRLIFFFLPILSLPHSFCISSYISFKIRTVKTFGRKEPASWRELFYDTLLELTGTTEENCEGSQSVQ